MSKSWVVRSVRDFEDALKRLMISAAGFAALALLVGLGVAFLNQPIDGANILAWICGAACFAACWRMFFPREAKVIFWLCGLMSLAFGFFG